LTIEDCRLAAEGRDWQWMIERKMGLPIEEIIDFQSPIIDRQSSM
jgi:hypothetical protein